MVTNHTNEIVLACLGVASYTLYPHTTLWTFISREKQQQQNIFGLKIPCLALESLQQPDVAM